MLEFQSPKTSCDDMSSQFKLDVQEILSANFRVGKLTPEVYRPAQSQSGVNVDIVCR